MKVLSNINIIIIQVLSVHAGEALERGIQNAIILEADESLLLSAQEEFDEVLQNGEYTFCTLGIKKPYSSLQYAIAINTVHQTGVH